MNLLIFGQDVGGNPQPIGGVDLANPDFLGMYGLTTIAMLRTGSGVYMPQAGQSVAGGAQLTSAPAPATGVLAGTTALSTTALQLPAHAGRGILLFNDATAGIAISIGDATTQPIKLLPGDSWSADIANLNLLYAKAASGTPALAWLVFS
jgi:hypothetical protein